MFCVRKESFWIAAAVILAGANAWGAQERLEYQGEILGDVIASMFAEFEPDSEYRGEWKLAHSEVVEGEYAIDEFVPKSERIDHWTRLFTQQNFRRKFSSASSPAKMMEGLRKAMAKRCPAVAWTVVSQSQSDVLYEFHFDECGGQPAQHELARILYGKWNIWRLAYTVKGPPLEGQERQRWLDALQEPRIVRW